MRTYLFILFCFIATNCKSLLGQCPDRDSVWKKIFSIQNLRPVNVNNQLGELLSYNKKMQDCSLTHDSVYTYLLMRIGVMYYKLADYYDAIQYTKRSIDIIHSNSGNSLINRKHLIKLYYYLSIYYDSLKLFTQKDVAADSCISNDLKMGSDYRYTVDLLPDKVLHLFLKGDFKLCIEYATFGETLIKNYYSKIEKSENVVESFLIHFFAHKISSLYSLKKFTEAEQFLISKRPELLKMKNNSYIAWMYKLMADINESKEEYKKALYYLRRAYRADLLTKERWESASILSRIGTIYSQKYNNDRLSLRYYYEALKYSNTILTFQILGEIANVYTKKKNFDSALYFFQKAFDGISPGINERDFVLHVEDYVNANIAESAVNLVLDKADTYLDQYLIEKNIKALHNAINVYKTADQLLDKIKIEQEEIQSRLSWRIYALRLYEHAIEACYLSNDLSDAFYFFERSRAVLLNDQLNQLGKIAIDDILKLAQLRKQIVELERGQNLENPTSKKYETFQTELFSEKQEMIRTEKLIKTNNPIFYQSFLDTNFISLNDVIRKILWNHDALLEIFHGDSAVFVITVTAAKIDFIKINKTDYDSTTKLYISFISHPDLLNRDYPRFNKTAHHLYQLLFQNNPPLDGRLIISPDGQYFPFEPLITNTDLSSPDYFLNDHTVSYTYSARFLLNNFTSSSTAKIINFLGVAPVQYNSSLSLPPLRGSDRSLNEIEKYFVVAVNFISGQASKNNFESQFSKYKVIQLYTHASDSSRNNEPVIFFADSALYLSDLIPESKPATQLIVLSACETGKGQLYQGEGVFSFNRGFAALGIPSSITNLWSVDNKSTYKITELFYKYLSKGLPLDIALQNAKKEFIRTGSKESFLPYYWAAPILCGKTDKVELHKSFSWIIIIAILLSVLIVLALGNEYFFGKQK
jgi:CHAT domain-containing protein